MLSKLNEITFQYEMQNIMTNKVFGPKKVKTRGGEINCPCCPCCPSRTFVAPNK